MNTDGHGHRTDRLGRGAPRKRKNLNGWVQDNGFRGIFLRSVNWRNLPLFAVTFSAGDCRTQKALSRGKAEG
jgi:hypothetical protein